MVNINYPQPGTRAFSSGGYTGMGHLRYAHDAYQPENADKLDSQTLWEKYGIALVAAVLYPDRVK